jgi:hypothetical protein
MSTIDTIIAKIFIPGMFLGVLFPLVAIVFSFIFYFIHRDRIEPERRVPAVAYVLALIVCGGVAGYAGLVFGIMLACPKAGNLCGLFGFFVTGPISLSLAIFLIASALFLVRPTPKS